MATIGKNLNTSKGTQAVKSEGQRTVKEINNIAKLEELACHIYDTLGCREEQTRVIISTMLGDIQLFDKKQHDYGPGNIAKFGEYGVLVRTNDKLERLINLNKRGDTPANESIMDTWQDLSVYGAIARVVKQNQ